MRLCILLLLASTSVSAQTVYYGTRIMEWDAPTKLSSGAPIPATDVLTYQVGRWPAPVSDRTAATIIAEVPVTNVSVTAPADGKAYVYAVRSKLVTDGGGTTLYSAWSWSDQATIPFALRAPSIDGPGGPGNLRLR